MEDLVAFPCLLEIVFHTFAMSGTNSNIVKIGGAIIGAVLLGYASKKAADRFFKGSKKPRYLVGIDLGATNAKAGVVNDDGELLAVFSEPLDDYSDKGVVASLVKVATKAVEEAGLTWSKIAEIGVGSPGTIDFDVFVFIALHPRTAL